MSAPNYGNWQFSGLDCHMGGHYLSALALMWASTGDALELRFVARPGSIAGGLYGLRLLR